MTDETPESSRSTLAAVEIITEAYRVTGNCRGVGEHLRLVDLLNNPEVSHLQLSEVEVRELLGSREVVASASTMFVDKDSVVLGCSRASPEEEARRNEAHRFDLVQKDKQLMLVFAPPFRVLGNVYLIKDAEPSIALPKLFEGFLAMTEASVCRDGASELNWKTDFIVVNGRRMQMVCATPQDYGETKASAA